MQTPLATAIVFLYALCGLTVLGLLVLFALKLRNISVEKQTMRCLEKYRDYFVYLQAHGEEDERLQVPYGDVTQKEKQIIQKKLFELMERVTGIHRDKLIWLCEDMGLVELDMQRLNGWWKWTRVDAAYNLGIMRSKLAVPALLTLLQKNTNDTSVFIIARSVAKCARNTEDLREMVTRVVGAKKNVHQLIVDIISDAQVDTAPLFAQFLQESDAELVKIGLIGYAVHAQPGIEPALYQLIQSPDKEVRIKAVKLMSRDIRYMNEQTVTDFMNHKDWEIRAMAAKAIGSLKLHSYIPSLKKAVGDANWWVRHHSARSLAQLEVEGFAALCEILQEERNSHKSEMAHQVIQEELEKEKLVLQRATATTTEKLVQYNEKLHLYRKSYRKTISTVQVLER